MNREGMAPHVVGEALVERDLDYMYAEVKDWSTLGPVFVPMLRVAAIQVRDVASSMSLRRPLGPGSSSLALYSWWVAACDTDQPGAPVHQHGQHSAGEGSPAAYPPLPPPAPPLDFMGRRLTTPCLTAGPISDHQTDRSMLSSDA